MYVYDIFFKKTSYVLRRQLALTIFSSQMWGDVGKNNWSPLLFAFSLNDFKYCYYLDLDKIIKGNLQLN